MVGHHNKRKSSLPLKQSLMLTLKLVFIKIRFYEQIGFPIVTQELTLMLIWNQH
jgi:hypothetical protein